MTTEKYLERLSWLANTIASRNEQITLGRSRATNMVVPTDNTPVQSSPKDKLCEIMSEVADLDKELQTYKAEFRLIMSQVNSLSGIYSPAFIYRRYAREQSVNEIASEMHVSRSTVYRIQSDALAEFEEKFGEIYKDANNYGILEHYGTF